MRWPSSNCPAARPDPQNASPMHRATCRREHLAHQHREHARPCTCLGGEQHSKRPDCTVPHLVATLPNECVKNLLGHVLGVGPDGLDAALVVRQLLPLPHEGDQLQEVKEDDRPRARQGDAHAREVLLLCGCVLVVGRQAEGGRPKLRLQGIAGPGLWREHVRAE
eukprot:4391004-Alexandrium_andersonii.AAC.1